MKIVRIALAVLGGLILVLVVAAVILINTFDPNSLKDDMTAWVQERTGRRLDIEQDIKLSLFPWFAVETGGVTLGDDPAFGERDFVRIDSLSARIRVWPLLRREVEVGRVVLDGVLLNLGVDGDGRGNWSTLLPQNSSTTPDTGAGGQDSPLFAGLAVEGIDLRNATIQWHDAAGELRYLVRDLQIETGPIHDDDPVDLSLSLSLFDPASQITVALELDAEAERPPSIALHGVESSIRVVDAAGAEVLEIDAALAMLTLDTASETLAIDGLTLSTGGIEVVADLEGVSLLSAPQLSGGLQVSGTTIAAVFDALGLATPPELATAGEFSSSADFAVGLSPLTVVVDRYSLAALGLEARGNASRSSEGGIAARIEVPTFGLNAALRGLLAPRLPPGTDLAALSSLALTANLALPAGSDRLEISELVLAVNSARVTGRLAVTGVTDPSRIQGQITATGVDNPLLRALLGDQLPADLRDTEIGEFRLATTFDYARQPGRAILDPLELAAYGLSGDGRMTVETGGDSLRLSGQASLAPFSPRALLTRFDLPVPASADPRALGRAELAASFQTTGSSGSFRDIALTLDDSRITGEFRVENFADPLYRFVLRADRIDADRYLPPKGASAPATGNPGPAAAGAPGVTGAAAEKRLGDIRLDNEALTATRLIGSVNVGDLAIGGMRFQQLATDLAIGDGRAALSSVRTQLYGGDFAGGIEIDTTGELPAVHLNGTANTLALEPLLLDMLGGSSISGTGNFVLDLSGRGETIGQAMQSAAGSLTVSFREGELDGINLDRELCAGMNKLNSLPAPATAPDATRYRVISGSAAVGDGIASTSNLYATTGSVELTGTGRFQLADQWQRNDFVARLTGPIDLQGCERLNSRIDNSIPIGFGFEGKLPDIVWSFDYEQLLADWARREIRNNVRDALEDRLREALD